MLLPALSNLPSYSQVFTEPIRPNSHVTPPELVPPKYHPKHCTKCPPTQRPKEGPFDQVLAGLKVATKIHKELQQSFKPTHKQQKVEDYFGRSIKKAECLPTQSFAVPSVMVSQKKRKYNDSKEKSGIKRMKQKQASIDSYIVIPDIV